MSKIFLVISNKWLKFPSEKKSRLGDPPPSPFGAGLEADHVLMQLLTLFITDGLFIYLVFFRTRTKACASPFAQSQTKRCC